VGNNEIFADAGIFFEVNVIILSVVV